MAGHNLRSTSNNNGNDNDRSGAPPFRNSGNNGNDSINSMSVPTRNHEREEPKKIDLDHMTREEVRELRRSDPFLFYSIPEMRQRHLYISQDSDTEDETEDETEEEIEEEIQEEIGEERGEEREDRNQDDETEREEERNVSAAAEPSANVANARSRSANVSPASRNSSAGSADSLPANEEGAEVDGSAAAADGADEADGAQEAEGADEASEEDEVNEVVPPRNARPYLRGTIKRRGRVSTEAHSNVILQEMFGDLFDEGNGNDEDRGWNPHRRQERDGEERNRGADRLRQLGIFLDGF